MQLAAIHGTVVFINLLLCALCFSQCPLWSTFDVFKNKIRAYSALSRSFAASSFSVPPCLRASVVGLLMRKKLIAANWKMYKTPDAARDFVSAFLPSVKD